MRSWPFFLSLLPMDTHPGISTAKTDYVKKDSLVSILKDNGYETAVLHAHRGSFFNRTKNYAKIGIEHFYDSEYYSGERYWDFLNHKTGIFFNNLFLK